jgi:hypothetical protein
MDVRELVDRATANYSELPPVPFRPDMPDADAYLATPDRLAWALGWIGANAIVQARYAGSGIDALPIFHPENGWDRFLLTRRMTAQTFRNESANRFGMLMLSGEDPPRLTKVNEETRVAFGSRLRDDPVATIDDLCSRIPHRPVPDGDLGYRWRDRQRMYPILYQVVTELIVDFPGLIAAREIFVDDQPVDGAYHPLYLHAVALKPGLVYDWFMVQFGERAAFFRIHGGQSIYETNRRGWATVKKQLADETPEAIRSRILAWLRIEGEPDQKTVD